MFGNPKEDKDLRAWIESAEHEPKSEQGPELWRYNIYTVSPLDRAKHK